MSDRGRDKLQSNAMLELARVVVRAGRGGPPAPAPASTTRAGTSTAAGTNPTSPVWSLPKGGVDGDVLALTDVGGKLLPQWVTPEDSGGGGSAGTGRTDPDATPAAPSTIDDEFKDGTIDGKWTIVNNPAAAGDTLSESRVPGFLHVRLTENPGTDNFDALVRMYQTPPAAGAVATYIAKLALTVEVDSNQTGEGGEFAGARLYLGNSTNDQAIAVGVEINVGSLGAPLTANYITISGATFSGVAQQMSGVLVGQWAYVRLDKTTTAAYTSANTYRAYLSFNGLVWHLIGSHSFTFTTAPDEVGLLFRRPKPGALGSPEAVGIVEFIRRTV